MARERFVIRQLSKNRLSQAIKLVHSVFKIEAGRRLKPGSAFRKSLIPTRERRRFRSWHWSRFLKYFLLIDTRTNMAIGTSGLYSSMEDEKSVYWLGWFCIDPTYRGRGLGQMLLRWTIDRARLKGCSIFKLYTSTDPDEAAAQKLYEKEGLIIVGRKEVIDSPYTLVFREKKL